jgi:hypothetical protein
MSLPSVNGSAFNTVDGHQNLGSCEVASERKFFTHNVLADCTETSDNSSLSAYEDDVIMTHCEMPASNVITIVPMALDSIDDSQEDYSKGLKTEKNSSLNPTNASGTR